MATTMAATMPMAMPPVAARTGWRKSTTAACPRARPRSSIADNAGRTAKYVLLIGGALALGFAGPALAKPGNGHGNGNGHGHGYGYLYQVDPRTTVVQQVISALLH